MNASRRLITTGKLLTLAAWLVLPAGRPLAQESRPRTGVSTNAADKAECKRRLNIITGAIREYRKQHGGKPPDSLADLTPDYIHDPEILICPVVVKRGGLRTWKKQFNELAPDPYTSYGYEFPPVAVDPYRWRGVPKKTWREVKERQVELLGDVVPIVRCHDHFPWLNLSVGGRIYESDTVYWERNFVEDEEDLLTLAKLFPSPPATQPMGPEDFPPRDPSASPQLLDLTASYNATLTNGWQGFVGNHLAGLSNGIVELDGVQFDIRGVIQLRGTIMPTSFPLQVAGIKVRQKCARIHFLHALSFIYPRDKPQASYWMHYADGQVQEFRVVYGQHAADWWYDPQIPSSPIGPTIAWSGQNEAAKACGMAVRLYHAIWENPLKDTEIKTITLDVVSKKHLSGLFVVAITLE